MPTNKKAVREAAVDWCLKNDLHDDSVDAFRRFFPSCFIIFDIVAVSNMWKSGLTWVQRPF